jgi:hypothetical protein
MHPSPGLDLAFGEKNNTHGPLNSCQFVSLGAKACATLCQRSRKFVPKAAQRNSSTQLARL